MIIIIRTIIIYIVVVFSLRFMGKKQIGQLEPSELAVAIMISDLASIPLASKDISLLSGIVPVLILTICAIITSALILKTVRIRKFVIGNPEIIVEKGVLNEKVMRSLYFTTDDLIEEMRVNSITDITDIQYALLETNGKVSFLLNKEKTPPTAEDLNIAVAKSDLAFPVVSNGVIIKSSLDIIGRDEEWLMREITKRKIKNKKDILLMTANHQKAQYVQLKETKK